MLMECIDALHDGGGGVVNRLKYTRQFYLSAGRTINLYLPYLLLDFTLRLLLFSNFIITDLSDRPTRTGKALAILDVQPKPYQL